MLPSCVFQHFIYWLSKIDKALIPEWGKAKIWNSISSMRLVQKCSSKNAVSSVIFDVFWIEEFSIDDNKMSQPVWQPINVENFFSIHYENCMKISTFSCMHVTCGLRVVWWQQQKKNVIMREKKKHRRKRWVNGKWEYHQLVSKFFSCAFSCVSVMKFTRSEIKICPSNGYVLARHTECVCVVYFLLDGDQS